MPEPRKSTSTSSFGVGRREAHDSSDFYARFSAPAVSDDTHINRYGVVDEIYCVDARQMDEGLERIKPSSVALLVTSPPYFVGKEYEQAIDGDGRIPASYLDYLEMLHDVFAKCVEKLEPGGRIAVNVANLGRKPYRSLSSDVIGILQDRLGLLLRGEIIWRKAVGASGSCAWGSFQSATNPVLRDLTERVVIASKGRFDRAVSRPERAILGLPSEPSIFKDDFMDATTDVWDLPPESANRVGHPAPFPIELPQRLIELYTFRDDLVLDPFMGSGTTALAAVRTERHFVGFDIDKHYVQVAKSRVADERQRLAQLASSDARPVRVVLPPTGRIPTDPGAGVEHAARAGQKATDIAHALLVDSGFVDVHRPKPRAGIQLTWAATDNHGVVWHFDVVGAFTTPRTGLRRSDLLWRSLGQAAIWQRSGPPGPLVLLTPELPSAASAAGKALLTARGDLLVDALDLLSPTGRDRLARYAREGAPPIAPG